MYLFQAIPQLLFVRNVSGKGRNTSNHVDISMFGATEDRDVDVQAEESCSSDHEVMFI